LAHDQKGQYNHRQWAITKTRGRGIHGRLSKANNEGMRIAKAIFNLLVDAATAWSQDKASLYAASIAYYMTFSIAPMLVLAISIAGRVFSQAAIEGEIVAQVEAYIGSESALLLQNLLHHASFGSSSFTIISSLFLLWAASGVFNHLKRALDIIYGVTRRPMPPSRGILHALRTRFFAFAMVIFMGLLLLIALALNTVVTTMGSLLVEYFPDLAEANSTIARFIAPTIMFLLFGIIFKALPEARIAWRDVWLGSAVTTLLFLLGNFFISYYLSITNVGSVYGAAGSLIVVLVWIYYSAQIVMYGAEFTKLFAIRYGSGILPSSQAITLAEFYSNHVESSVDLSDLRNQTSGGPRVTDEVEETAEDPSYIEQD
jgi:membrane protein